MSKDLSGDLKIRRVAVAVIAGTSTQTSSAVDTTGFESTIFLASVGTAAVNNILSVEASADGSTGWAAVTGAAVVPGASDAVQWVEVVRSSVRYLRASVARGTSTTLESIWAIQGNPSVAPVGNATAGTVAGIVKSQY